MQQWQVLDMHTANLRRECDLCLPSASPTCPCLGFSRTSDYTRCTGCETHGPFKIKCTINGSIIRGRSFPACSHLIHLSLLVEVCTDSKQVPDALRALTLDDGAMRDRRLLALLASDTALNHLCSIRFFAVLAVHETSAMEYQTTHAL